VPLLPLVLPYCHIRVGLKTEFLDFVLGRVRKAQVIFGSPKRWDGDGDEVCAKGLGVGKAHDGDGGGRKQREGGGECVDCGARAEKCVRVGEGV